jgi:hypothetical protein
MSKRNIAITKSKKLFISELIPPDGGGVVLADLTPFDAELAFADTALVVLLFLLIDI